MADDEIDLKALSDADLVEQMHNDLYDGLKPEVVEGVDILLARGWTPYDVLTKALVEGMRIVGIDFRDGILFVPEVLMSANAMKAGMAILKPLLAETGAPKVGKMVIGTVKGDIHDIGKNLVCMMMEGAGFEVVDLGINNSVDNYLKAIEEHQPEILGMSALLTTTMPYMKVVIDTLKEKGIRDDYVVLVGGAPLNEAFAQSIGADAYCRDAAMAVETAKTLLARRQGLAHADPHRDVPYGLRPGPRPPGRHGFRPGTERAGTDDACDRLRCPGSGTHIGVARQRLRAFRHHVLAGRPAQPARPYRASRPGPHPSQPGAVPPHPLPVRRLRHRRSAGSDAGGRGRGTDRWRALLRHVRRAGSLRGHHG